MIANYIVFGISAAIILGGAIGVILARNPVHSALFLIQTLFGVAVIFLLQEAHFLAAVQVIVYAGAIVILFLFVIMLLGVDRAEELGVEPIAGQRPVAVVLGGAIVAVLLTIIVTGSDVITGQRAQVAPIIDNTDGLGQSNVEQLGNRLFTDWVFAFELTGLLLTIAVVGAVMLVRRVKGDLAPIPEPARAAVLVPELELDDESSPEGENETDTGNKAGS